MADIAQMQNASTLSGAEPRIARPVRASVVRTSSPAATLVFTIAVVGTLAWAWSQRDTGRFSPEEGLGYQLGIIGTAMMASLLLYPLRKRVRWLRGAGAVRHWFRAHMALGVLGPACVLVHCNFDGGSPNSRIALYSMLLVAGSGIAGRYLYSRVHDGLYGSRSSLVALSLTLSASRHRLAESKELEEAVRNRLLAMGEGVDSHPAGLLAGLRQAVSVAAKTLWIGMLLDAHELRAAYASERIYHEDVGHSALSGRVAGCPASSQIASPWVRFVSGRARVHAYLRLVRRVAGLAFFERVFSLWRMLHVPLFVLLIATTVVHVIAVHRY
jgi:hypothetical protein